MDTPNYKGLDPRLRSGRRTGYFLAVPPLRGIDEVGLVTRALAVLYGRRGHGDLNDLVGWRK